MERYNKYIDKENRLFILLGINSRKENERWINHSVDLLNVNEERVQEVNLTDFENYINKKLLNRVK